MGRVNNNYDYHYTIVNHECTLIIIVCAVIISFMVIFILIKTDKTKNYKKKII